MVSKSVGMSGLLLVALAGGVEPEGMIARLGASKFADREEASAALEKLGISAFPALKAARNDHDPEVKNRAELILDTIERSLLTRPTAVRLDARRYSAAELAEKLSVVQGIPIGIVEAGDLVPPARASLDIVRAETLDVWPLMDRLGMTFQWDFEQVNDFGTRQPARRTATLKLVPRGLTRAKTTDTGPFRVVLGNAHSAAENPGPFDAGGGGMGGRRGGGTFRMAGGEVALVIPLDVHAEPRLTLHTTGAIRVNEAVDDAGNSVAANLRGELDQGNLYTGDRAVSTAKLRLRLKGLELPPRILKRLRGTIPVEVEARRIEPIVIPIPTQGQAEMRPVTCGGATVQVRGLTTRAFAAKGSYVLDLTVRRDGWSFAGMGGRGRMGQVWGVVSADTVWDNLEIVDAKGRPFRIGAPRTIGAENDGAHVQLDISPRTEADAPTDVRFFGSIRTTVEIPFDFRDVKLR
jgi:hypothetical protein